jgi:hypothetical protein
MEPPHETHYHGRENKTYKARYFTNGADVEINC